MPVFQRVIDTIEAAKLASAEIRGRLANDMGKAQERMEQQLGLVMGEFDAATTPLLEGVETVKRRGRKGTGRATASVSAATAPATGDRLRASVTPPSNRGVRSTANPRKTTEKAKA